MPRRDDSGKEEYEKQYLCIVIGSTEPMLKVGEVIKGLQIFAEKFGRFRFFCYLCTQNIKQLNILNGNDWKNR